MSKEKKQALLDADAHKILMKVKKDNDLKSLSAAVRFINKEIKKDK